MDVVILGSTPGLTTFDSEEATARWRDDLEHLQAQDLGRTHFYEDYTLEVAKVERSYSWERPGS